MTYAVYSVKSRAWLTKSRCFSDSTLSNMNVGGVLAGGGGLSCKLQAEVGALDLIGEGESAFINRTSFKILVVVN